VFFLRGIPMMARSRLRPHRRRGEIRCAFGYLDLVPLVHLWTFLYDFAVLPWIYASPMSPSTINLHSRANIQNWSIALRRLVSRGSSSSCSYPGTVAAICDAVRESPRRQQTDHQVDQALGSTARHVFRT